MRAKILLALGLLILPFSRADLIRLSSGDTMDAIIRGYEKQELIVFPTGATSEVRIPISMVAKSIIRQMATDTRQPVPPGSNRPRMQMTQGERRVTARNNRLLNRYYDLLKQADKLKTDAYNLEVQAGRLGPDQRGDAIALKNRGLGLLNRADQIYDEARKLQRDLQRDKVQLTRIPPPPDAALRQALQRAPASMRTIEGNNEGY